MSEPIENTIDFITDDQFKQLVELVGLEPKVVKQFDNYGDHVVNEIWRDKKGPIMAIHKLTDGNIVGVYAEYSVIKRSEDAFKDMTDEEYRDYREYYGRDFGIDRYTVHEYSEFKNSFIFSIIDGVLTKFDSKGTFEFSESFGSVFGIFRYNIYEILIVQLINYNVDEDKFNPNKASIDHNISACIHF